MMGTVCTQAHSGNVLLNDGTALSGSTIRRIIRVGAELAVLDVTNTTLKHFDSSGSKQYQSVTFALPAVVVIRQGNDLVQVALS